MFEELITDPEKIENPALSYAIILMKQKRTAESEAKLLNELKKAKLITPAVNHITDREGNPVKLGKNDMIPSDSNISVRVPFIKNGDGAKYIPVLTNMDQYRKVDKEGKAHACIMTLRQYAEMLSDEKNDIAGLVIDPYGSNVSVPKKLILDLKKAADGRTEGNMVICDVEEYPDELEDVLTDFFDENGSVKNAYFKLMKNNNTETVLLVADVDIPDDAAEDEARQIKLSLFEKTASVCSSKLKDVKGFSIVALDEDFKNKYLGDTKPFYTR